MTTSGARALRATAALGLAALTTSLAACGAPATSAGGGGRTLTVLAAASLTDVFEQVAADFEADHPGVTVEQSFSASSTIVQQVNEGAPADVIALAGQSSLDPLAPELRLGPPVVFTTNTLELAVPADNPAGIGGTQDLTKDGIRLVVCQPEVPCGTAARTLFEHLGISPDVASFEPDVRATLSKVELGEADVGVVYRTDVAAAGDGVAGVEIPAADNVVSSYPVLAVSGSPLAQAFIDEVMSGRGQQRLADAGFVAP
ncbi:molybdate ABC transporter substrate-binding protein [Ornithinimicrobium avium]|uniref:Molybdate ABC transporter substrate-binding protein n=1 Tax=Ornithinimicrobium avium TaxID=2283195 RepID=A0A345NQW8_9MICO|nr:molybdate ABC transporter substrate-binding protein [Ornithinimicrobium avium]AXH97426.1 molybdate ABC transporter substrate-binding protein [Ornithinimicrobium avium]